MGTGALAVAFFFRQLDLERSVAAGFGIAKL